MKLLPHHSSFRQTRQNKRGSSANRPFESQVSNKSPCMKENKPQSSQLTAPELDVFFVVFFNILQVKVLMHRADDGEEENGVKPEETRAA